jgi:hypothetical protein
MVYDLEKYRPVQLDDLIRLGRKFDGGYVISKRQIEKTKVLLSFGINDDWSFESDFEKSKHIKIFAYDYSVSWDGELGDHIRCMLGYLLDLRRSKVKETWKFIKKAEKNLKSLNNFFQRKYDRYFIPKYLGEYDAGKYISFDRIFKKLKDIGSLSVFIKMDIEGAEYKTLPCLLPYFDKINGLVVEFHGLDNPVEFEEISQLLLKSFYVAHIHANNSGGYIINSMLPMTLEITFIHKNMLSENITFSSCDYPLPGLDFPNENTLDDMVLRFNKSDTG